MSDGTMDKMKGKAKEAAGAAREKAGEMMDDEEMEAKGTVQKHEGKGDQAVGEAKERLDHAKKAITGS